MAIYFLLYFGKVAGLKFRYGERMVDAENAPLGASLYYRLLTGLLSSLVCHSNLPCPHIT
jgi:hypothetical protein